MNTLSRFNASHSVSTTIIALLATAAVVGIIAGMRPQNHIASVPAGVGMSGGQVPPNSEAASAPAERRPLLEYFNAVGQANGSN